MDVIIEVRNRMRRKFSTEELGAFFPEHYRGSNLAWYHYEVVVKFGRVFDAFTGHKGLSIDKYKELWQYAAEYQLWVLGKYMRNFLAILDRLCARPGMYVRSETYNEIVAFIEGYDLAQNGSALQGLREWLIVQLQGGNNLSWSQLIMEKAFPDRNVTELSIEEQQSAISVLHTLLHSFLVVRTQRHGLRHIYLSYQSWLQEQSWYSPDKDDYIQY